MVTIKKSIGWRSGCSGGRKKEKRLRLLGPSARGGAVRLHGKKRNRVQKWSSLDASQGWTLKDVFLFFPFRLGRSPKELCLFSFFLGPALLPSLSSAGKNIFPPQKKRNREIPNSPFFLSCAKGWPHVQEDIDKAAHCTVIS